MKFARPFIPLPPQRAHITAGLRLLANYIEDYPHVFRVQRDSRSLLSPSELRQVADALNDPNGECVPEAPFFFSEERDSIRGGLLALADMSRLFGPYATADHFSEIFVERGLSVSSPAEIVEYIGYIDQMPAIDEMGIKLDSPHKAQPPLESTYLVTHSGKAAHPAGGEEIPMLYDPDIPPLQQLAPYV